MKTIVCILLLSCAIVFSAPFNSYTLTFTNLPTNSCTFVINSTTITWTTAPLNSISWIQSNSISGSATNLKLRLGAQYSAYRSYQTNSTNVFISGSGLQISITGNYGFVTTNSLASNTNRILLDLPFDYMFETNRTNAADALIYGIDKYNRTNFFNPNTNGPLKHWASLTHTQRMSDKIATNFTSQGGSASNTAFINIASHSGSFNSLTQAAGMGIQSARLTNATGEFRNSYGSNWIIHTLTATNFSAPGSGTDSQRIGSGASASGNSSLAFGVNALATNANTVAVGVGAEARGNASVAIGTAAIADTNSASVAVGPEAYALGIQSIAIGQSAFASSNYAVAIGSQSATTETNQIMLGDKTYQVSVPGKLMATNVTQIHDAVRYSQSGPWSFSEGAYASMTGGSNNVSQASTNAWTRLSGHVSACNLNSMRTGDGLPMSGRRHGIINGGSFDITLIDTLSDGFETLNTNEMDLGGINITLAPKDRAEFIYSATSARWELLYPKPPTNLVVKSTADFSGADTTNVFTFATQMRRMTNAMTTNATFIVSNILAGSSVEIFLIGANGGVIASNYTFTVRTNSLPTASQIHWVTSTNGTYDVAVSSNKFGRIILTAPFATNVFAKYEEGP